MARISVKLLLVFFLFNLAVAKVRLKATREDYLILSFPAYQLFTSLFKGDFLSFLRAPNGLTPSLSYLLRFSGIDPVKGLNLFLLGASLLSLVSSFQSLFWVPDYRLILEGKFSLHPFSVHRPHHTLLGHPLTAGMVVSAAFLLSVILYLRQRRWIYLLAALLNLFGVIFLFDRTYWVSLLAVSFLVFFVVLRDLRLFISFVLVFFLSLGFVPQLKERFVSIFDIKHNGSNRYRIAMWVGALSFYRSAPLKEKLLGVSRKGYREEVKPFVERAERRFSLPPHLFSHLHNNFVTVLVWYGLFGLILYLILFSYFILVNLKAFRATGDYLFLFFFSFYLTLFLGGFFEYNFENEAVKFMLYAISGLNVKLLSGLRAP